MCFPTRLPTLRPVSPPATFSNKPSTPGFPDYYKNTCKCWLIATPPAQNVLSLIPYPRSPVSCPFQNKLIATYSIPASFLST